jgi:PAS domain S-box-containing protein
MEKKTLYFLKKNKLILLSVFTAIIVCVFENLINNQFVLKIINFFLIVLLGFVSNFFFKRLLKARDKLNDLAEKLLIKERHILDTNEKLEVAKQQLIKKNKALIKNEQEFQINNLELKNKEMHYRTLFETSTDAIFVETLTGNILDCNNSACLLYGYNKEEILNLKVDDLIPEYLMSEIKDKISDYVRKQNFSFEGLAKNKNGKIFPVEITGAITKINGEDVAVVYVHNIENRKKTEKRLKMINEELRNVNEELKSLDELKNNFLSNVSHELRTPLVAVRGYTEIIISGKSGVVSEKQKGQLNIILRSIDRLVSLINSLLEFTRLNSGKSHLKCVFFDMKTLIKNSIKELRFKLSEKHIVVEQNFDEQECLIFADRYKISQVLINILDNAIKFSEYSSVIKISLKRQEKILLISVKDSGIGIDRENLPKIFERFYQVDSSATRKFGGLGIGLAICKFIIELHNGKIDVKSELGQGTEFIFSLPLPDSAEIEKKKLDETNKFRLNNLEIPKNLLIVDNEKEILSFLKIVLETEKFNIFLAEDEIEAMEILESKKIDLILLDIALNGISGLEVCRKIKSIDKLKNIPIIFITARIEENINKDAFEVGAVDLIKKPFKISDLLKRIYKYLLDGQIEKN